MIAPVTYDRNFPGEYAAGVFFRLLWQTLPWEKREGAPRREAWFNPYGEPYTYGQGEHARTYQANGLPRHPKDCNASFHIRCVMNALNAKFESQYDCCFVNGYENGRQHLGWHSDDSPEMDMDHPIATVSLGAAREIWFRPKERDANLEPEKLMLANGSVAIMAAGMQRDWQHRIPKSSVADCGPRISLTYRKLVR